MFNNRTLIATLPASDINRARQWYADKLDLKPTEEQPDGGLRYATGDSWFLVYPSTFAGTNQATAAAFEVEDIADVVGSLRGRGVVFEEYDFGDIKTENGIVTMPDGSQGAFFKDSEGNIIGVYHQA